MTDDFHTCSFEFLDEAAAEAEVGQVSASVAKEEGLRLLPDGPVEEAVHKRLQSARR